MQISKINLIEILNSRGMATVQVTMQANAEFTCISSAPSGASKGSNEALEVYDNDVRFKGRGVKNICRAANEILNDKLVGHSFESIFEFDTFIEGLGSPGIFGANVKIALSYCCLKLLAQVEKTPLYMYISKNFNNNEFGIPIPMINVINGGAHADNNVCIQEFMLVPNCNSMSDNLEISFNCFSNLKEIAKAQGHSISVGDEGGIAPNLNSTYKALDMLMSSCSNLDIKLALDCAASEFYKKNNYYFDNSPISNFELSTKLEGIISNYPVVSLEDPFAETDLEGWKHFNRNLNRVQIVGDDLLVTNPDIINNIHKLNVVNCAIIKPNQIGNISLTISAIKLCKNLGYKTILSHRSGDTEDPIIADISVGFKSDFIKTGNICRGERTVKYNRLLSIESEIDN